MNQAALRAAAQQWLQNGEPALVVRVQAARGSVPRDDGVRMVVGRQAVLGTIGGGHLEWVAIQEARRALLQGDTPPPLQRLALGPALGQCCGGALELHYERLDAAALSAWALPPGRFHLVLYGAGHVGQALARLLVDVDCTVDWIDVREEAFPNPAQAPWVQSPGLQCVVSDGPVADALAAPAGAHHLVMTHSHALDYDIVQALLSRTDTGLVGVIGSKTKRQRFEHRLLARGLSPQRVKTLQCPIGLPGVRGKEPAVVAVAVAAQLLSWPQAGHAGTECGVQPTSGVETGTAAHGMSPPTSRAS